MSKKVGLVVSMDYDAAMTLKEQGVLTEYKSFEAIPETFKDVIKTFMIENVGFETGPIFCVGRINGEPAALRKSAFGGDLKVTDMLPVKAGDVILELSVDADTMVSIGMQQLFVLAEQAAEFGDDNELVLDLLKESLVAGPIIDDERNIFSFIPKIKKDDCSKFYLIDDEWKVNYSDIFGGIEEVTIASLAKF